MRRRSKTSGTRAKKGRPPPAKVGRSNVPKAARRFRSSLLGEETEITRLTRELNEAFEREKATSDVLQLVSGSPRHLESVFVEVLKKAVHICGAHFGIIYRFDGEFLHLVAQYNTPIAFANERQRTRAPYKSDPRLPLGQIIRTRSVIHLADAAAHEGYTKLRNPAFVAGVELGGVRTVLFVPMLKGNELIGVFTLYRQIVCLFTDKQIELVKNFAAQAVIAIENARLLNELRQRTDDLTEALEQQTATSDVLSVISASPGELERVFQSILENATRICEAELGILHLYENGSFRYVASRGAPPAYIELRQREPVFEPPAEHPLAQIAATKQVLCISDIAAESVNVRGRLPDLGVVRTIVMVPMLKEKELVGAISIFRQHVQPFTNKQIDLVRNFAAQAVIAIENARLLKELRERTELVGAQSQELVKLNQQLEQRVSDQIGEIERMGRLRRFLPPQVADLIVASGGETQLESHRREITALFCDLRGFTGFTESADAEDVMALLRDYHAAIGNIIIKYSGTLERYAGDGVMVIFNDPVPVDNPALQAVLMALEVRDAIGRLTEIWRRWGHEIGFGIGIAHGFATLGTIGFEGRFDYAAIGTVSNVASRLCDEAKPGQILISPRVLTKVENAVKVESVGEFELKGIRRPLAAYNVLAAIA